MLYLCGVIRGIAQKKLAMVSGVSERTLRSIANGQIDIDFYTLVEILTALEEGFAGFT